jgi:hypothetical protein
VVGLGTPEWLKRILATTHAIENLIGTAIVFRAVPGMIKERLQREVERILRSCVRRHSAQTRTQLRHP